MKKLVSLLVVCISAHSLQAQETQSSSCLTDSITIITNDTGWVISSNSLGETSNVNATIITYQYNTMPGYPDAKWISCMSNWTINTDVNDPDDSIAYNYQFNSCGQDTVDVKLTIKRDNYCFVYMDGILLLQDPVVYNTDFIDYGDLIDTTLVLDSGMHNLDVILYNRNSFNGVNGVGMMLGGYLKSHNGSLILNSQACSGYSCNTTTAVNELATISAPKVVIYPNPATTDRVFVEINNAENIGYVMLDVTGRIVRKSVFTKGVNAIDIEGLNSGLYILKLNGASQTYKIEKR